VKRKFSRAGVLAIGINSHEAPSIVYMTRDTSRVLKSSREKQKMKPNSRVCMQNGNGRTDASLIEKTNCRGSLPPAVNFYRSCVELGWLARETTGFILVRASEE
jgi:hypothetical protein